MVVATCLFKDGRHTCGEPAIETVGLSPAGMAERSAPACQNHFLQVMATYDEVSSNSTVPVQTEPSTPEAVNVTTGDQVGSAEHT